MSKYLGENGVEKLLENVKEYVDNHSATGGGGGSVDWIATAASGNLPVVANNGTAIGYNSTATGSRAVALGLSTNASGLGAVAIGNGAVGNSTNAVAVGYYARASMTGVAIGAGANALSRNCVSVGYDANSGTNGVAVGRRAATPGENAVAIGASTNANIGGVAVGNDARAYESGGTAIGSQAVANAINGISIGIKSNATALEALAIGAGAKVAWDYSVAVGSGATATEAHSIVLGDKNIISLQCAVQTITTLSDERTKEDISYANTARCLEIVEEIPVKRFKYKKYARPNPLDKHKLGFIAQDVEYVFPNNVETFDDTFPVLDENGNPTYEPELDENGNYVYEQIGEDENGEPIYSTNPKMREKRFTMEGVKHLGFEQAIPSLWGAVQELSRKVKELEEKIK